MLRSSEFGAPILLILAMAGPGFAQQYSFRHYGASEGLQNLTILSLAQDGKGFVWAGSEAGLYRYDGTKFRLMGAAEGLPCSTEVHALHASVDGSLWANACSKLLRFDGHRFHAAAGVSEMLHRAQAMADGRNGHLVVATSSGLLEVVPDGPGGSFRARPYLAAQGPGRMRTRGIFRHGSQLWFGCEGSVCVEESGQVLKYGEAEGLPGGSWDAIGVTKDGAIWARSPNMLYRKAPGSGRFVKEEGEIAPSMYWGALTIGPDGELVVPTDNGVAMNQGDRWRLIDRTRGLRSPMAIAVLRDRVGALWVGLAGAGLARWLGNGEWESWTQAQGLPSSLIWSILRDKKGEVWVGTGMGLTRLYGKRPSRTWTRNDGLGGDNVRWLGEALDGAIWAITLPGGLARINPATGKAVVAGSETGLMGVPVRGLIDRAGRLWVATRGGLFRNDQPANSLRFERIDRPGLLNRGAWSVSEDQQGNVWVTGPDGLWRLKQGQWRRYQAADGLHGGSPYVVAVAADNSLYVRQRYDASIERLEFDGDRVLRSTVIVPGNAASVEVTAFHGFDALGRLWRGTAKGVSVLRDGTWMQYSTEDGLIWDDCDGEAFWADADGGVWIGTSGGLSHFRPSLGKHPEPAAEPIVTSIEIRKRPRLVRFSFSSLQYRFEQVVRFAYRLDDGPWTDTTERSVSIAGVGPGRHRLEIRSQIRSGPFSPKSAVTEFSVEPFWWETWWFRSAAVLLAAALICGGVLWRHRALRQRNAALERVVQERTMELQAERAAADAASEAKGQFLAYISHEIRTPLNGVLGLAALLDGVQDPADARELVRLIQSSGQMLLGVINDVLDFSKVEAGRLELDVAPFELRPSLEQAVGLFHASAAEKGLRVSLVLAPDLPAWTAGDEVRLRQVVQNLISNALKFTESGGISISASVEKREGISYLVRIEVRDTGVGISSDRIARLFTSFSQADASISRRYGGTGLGLAISKRLVELMGGSIQAESQPGMGSTFRFTVRLEQVANPGPEFTDTLAMIQVSTLRVLLAEDNKVNQIVALRLLEKFGVAADLATNGAEAVAAVMQNSYDLILMDVQMPVMDGIAATREIRTLLKSDTQPFICGLSAHATTDCLELCLLAGMNSYLTKPIDHRELCRILEDRITQMEV